MHVDKQRAHRGRKPHRQNENSATGNNSNKNNDNLKQQQHYHHTEQIHSKYCTPRVHTSVPITIPHEQQATSHTCMPNYTKKAHKRTEKNKRHNNNTARWPKRVYSDSSKHTYNAKNPHEKTHTTAETEQQWKSDHTMGKRMIHGPLQRGDMIRRYIRKLQGGKYEELEPYHSQKFLTRHTCG